MHSSRLWLCVAKLCLCAAPAVAAGNLIETVDRFDHLHAEPASHAVRDLRLSSGHLEVVFSSGNATVVRAGAETVGMLVQGVGSAEYRSVDPIEFPLTLRNLGKATSLTPEKKEGAIRVRAAVSRVLWLSGGEAGPRLAAGSGPSLDAALEGILGTMRGIRSAPFSHLFAVRRANDPAAPLVVALLEARGDTLEYVFDGVEARSESLVALLSPTRRDPEVKGWLLPKVLSDQPINRDRRDPLPPAFLLTEVSIDLTATAGKQASLTVQETIVPQGRAQTVFRFDLLSRTYNLVGAGALDPRLFRVREVTDGSGRALRFHHERDDLLVEAAAPAEPDRPLKLDFRIDGDFLVHPGGDNFWELGVEPWFPQPDLGEQYYTWRATVRVPRPFVPFASGTTVSRRAEGEMNIVESRIDRPIQFAVVLAGKYEEEDETRNGIRIRVATYAMKNSRAMKQLRALAFSIIDYYQAFLGPFPFPEFQILEINSYGFGQAPPGVMFITKEAFNPTMGEENQVFSQGVNERFAHEIAHQYWGHVVKMPSAEEQWLTESFAEYSAALFLRQFKGESTYTLLTRRWSRRADFAREAAPIPLANEIYDPHTGFLLRTGLLYDKGPLLLSALHKQLGDDLFLTFLKSYQRSFAWKFGTTRNVVSLLQFLTKKDFGPFFEANFWGTGMP
jgi:hypothetical protein